MALFAFVNMQLRQRYTQHDGHRTPTHCLSVRKYGEEVMADVTLRDVMRGCTYPPLPIRFTSFPFAYIYTYPLRTIYVHSHIS